MKNNKLPLWYVIVDIVTRVIISAAVSYAVVRLMRPLLMK